MRPGILPQLLFTKSSVPLKILGANDQRVGGDTVEIFGHLEASATGFSDREPIKIRFTTRLIQADISVDIFYPMSGCHISKSAFDLGAMIYWSKQTEF